MRDAKPTTGERNMSAGPIRDVDALVRALRACKRPEEYLPVLERVEIPEADYAEHCTWNDRQYTRNCIARTPDMELLLICYEKDQSTSIHDYDSERAWMKPVIGQVTEERYVLAPDGGLSMVNSTVRGTGDVSFMEKEGSIHRFINSHDGRSVTLNLYAKPLRRWKIYDERTGSANTAVVDH
jgi:cysteine dioxygenase